jgi:hypothetical protein
MKKIAVVLIALTFSSVIYAQKKDPPHWGSAYMEVAGANTMALLFNSQMGA